MEVDSVSYNHLQKVLQTVGEKFPKEVVEELGKSAYRIRYNAQKYIDLELAKTPQNKNKPSTHSGILHNQIYVNPENKGYNVKANPIYAPYNEFGTGEKVSVPEGWESYAMKFKGQKNIKGGMRPRPFLVKAFIEESKLIPRRVLDIYKRLVK
jgi:hypothetical protein